MAPRLSQYNPESMITVDKILDLAKEGKRIHFDTLAKTQLGVKGLGKLLDYLKLQGYIDQGQKRYLEKQSVEACNR